MLETLRTGADALLPTEIAALLAQATQPILQPIFDCAAPRIAFGTISNFGILARQRTQALPFVFVLLALYPSRHETDAGAVEQERAQPR